MLKICLCSDNHNNRDALSKILNDNPTCDYYFHLGDSGMSQDDLYPFISIKGNNDWLNDFPIQRIVNLNNRKILMIHGNGYTDSYNMLINKTRKEKCDVLFLAISMNLLMMNIWALGLLIPEVVFTIGI